MFEGKTFDDFLLIPQLSLVKSRRTVDLSMPLTARITLNTPIVGANMDTVTGTEMAKALALEGGIGFLHRNCTLEEQVKMLRSVKSHRSFVIEKPTVLHRKVSLGFAKQVIEERNVSGILLEEEPGSMILAGILSHRDIPLNGKQNDRLVDEFMTPFERLLTDKLGVSIEEAEEKMFQKRVEKLPLVDDKRKITGLITMRDLKSAKKKPFFTKDTKGRLAVGGTIGAAGDFLERAEALISAEADCLLMDIATAHNLPVVKKALEQFRNTFKSVDLICGNIGTGEGAMYLAELGANAVKVGIGPGRGCRTRLETGAGVAQLEAIHRAYCATDGRVPIVADGGMREHKDIFLALACGATSVMLGSMLSGTEESPGEVIRDPATKQKKKIYRGMTSPQAVLANTNEENLQDALDTPAEGQSIEVPYRGSVIDVIKEIRGHLQSAVSYAGAETLREAHERIAIRPERYLTPISKATQIESFER